MKRKEKRLKKKRVLQNPPDSVFCTKCGFNLEEERKKNAAELKSNPVKKKLLVFKNIALIIFGIAVIGLSIFSFSQNERIAVLENTIEEKESELEDKRKELNNTTKELNTSIKEHSDMMNTIKDFLDEDNAGFATNSFKADVPIVFLKRNDEPRRIYITGNYQTTYHVDISGDAVATEWSNEKWFVGEKTYIKLIIKEKGISRLTFSNEYNSKTFDVLVIVIE